MDNRLLRDMDYEEVVKAIKEGLDFLPSEEKKEQAVKNVLIKMVR